MDPLHGKGYVDQIAAGVAVARMQNATNFVALKATPRLFVNKPSGLFHELFQGDLLRDDMESRGPTAPAAKSGLRNLNRTFSTDAQSIELDYNEAQKAASDAEVSPDVSFPRALALKTLIRYERRFAGFFSSAAGWYRKVTGANADSLASDTAPDRLYLDNTSADPIEALTDEVERLGTRVGCGGEDVAIIFGKRLWHKVRHHAKVRAQVVGVANGPIGTALAGMARAADEAAVASLIGVRWIGVSRGVYNTTVATNDVTTETITNSLIVPQDDALIIVAPNAGNMNADPMLTLQADQPSAIYRPVWRGVPGTNEDGILIRRAQDPKAGPGGSEAWILDSFNGFEVQDTRCGVWLSNMVTP